MVSRKESTCQCRGHGFDPQFGKIPHALEQLSLWATTTELTCPRGRALQREATAVRSLCSTTRECSPCLLEPVKEDLALPKINKFKEFCGGDITSL